MYEIGISLIFVLVTLFLSKTQKLGIEKELFTGTLRTFAQLMLVGYVLNFIFGQENPFYTTGILFLMVTTGSLTCAKRGKGFKNAWLVAFFSIFIGTFCTLGVMIFAQALEFTPKIVIPVGGMVIGQATKSCSLSFDRMKAEFRNQKTYIEAATALGLKPVQFSEFLIPASFKASVLPMLDTLKIVGIIQLPGAMTGMIIAGAEPFEAVKFQILIMYLLLGAASFPNLILTFVCCVTYFDENFRKLTKE
ncbi:iron export ABC transporter permease subunit FetB [bacterium]|nr:iron export ABC transporter permease subunit FetB [bacterium]